MIDREREKKRGKQREIERHREASTPIGAWKVKLRMMADRQTN